MGNEIVFRLTPPELTTRDLRLAVDPGTVASVVGAAVDYFNGKTEIDWRNDVDSKLDRIMVQLNELAAEIKALRPWFEEKLIEQQGLFLRQDVDSKRKLINQILEGFGPNKGGDLRPAAPAEGVDTSRLLRIMDALLGVMYVLLDWRTYGYVQYAGVVSGALTALLVLDLMRGKVGRTERARVAKEIIAYLEPALDGKNEKSLEWARNQLALAAGNARGQVSSQLDKWWVTGFFEHQVGGIGGTEGSTPYYHQVWILTRPTGSPEGSFRCEEQRVVETHRPAEPWYPGVNRDFTSDQAKALILSDLHSRQQRYFEAAVVEQKAQSHIAEVVAALASLRSLA